MKTQIYTVQVLGIIAILCGYLLSNQPDHLSEMHFNPHSSCLAVFSKSTKTVEKTSAEKVFSSSQHNHSRKTKAPSFISYEVILPSKSTYVYHPYNHVVYDFPLAEDYVYLFYEEINPPPPKAC